MKKFFVSSCIALISAMLFTSVHAAPTFCSPGPNADGLALTDVSVNNINASNCYGVVMDNDDLAGMNAIGWGNNWAFAARDNIGGDPDVSNTVLGIQWSLTADPGKEGDWTLAGLDMNGLLPANLGDSFDLIAVLKGSDRYAAYLFSGIALFGSNAGEYDINFLNNGSRVPDLSHLSVYIRPGDGGTPAGIPEPGTIALAGLGLIGMGVFSRRRKT